MRNILLSAALVLGAHGVFAASGLAAGVSAVPMTPEYTGSVTIPIDAPPASHARGQWTILVNQTYQVVRGYAYSPTYEFRNGLATDALYGGALMAPQYPGYACGASLYAMDISLAPGVGGTRRYFPDSRGVIALPSSRVYKVMMIFYQPRVRGVCTIRLASFLNGDADPRPDPRPDPQPDPRPDPRPDPQPNPNPTPDFSLAGVLSYDGGFIHKDLVPLANPEVVLDFWVRIPSYCDVEVLEAGIIHAGVYRPATRASATSQIYQVEGGFGAEAEAIALSLNGPRGVQCDIPVYVRIKE